MSVIFESKDSVFFVGGYGTKAGNANAGGCTQAFWNSVPELDEVMATGGACKSEVVGAVVSNNGSGKVRLTKVAGFSQTRAELVANIEFSAVYANGRYEVIDVEVGGVKDWIDIDLAYQAPGNGEPTCDVWVGGAFDTLQNAADNTDAGNGYNVKIYDNKPETLTAAIDFDTTGGSTANNSHKIVEGFHTQPGDMNYGETYYQGPLDCLINGVNTNKCVTLDADGGAYDIVTISVSGIFLKNLYFFNTDKASGNNCVHFTDNPYNIGFINCKFDTAYGVMSGVAYGFEMRGCYIGNDFAYFYHFHTPYLSTAHITHCVINSEGRTAIYIRYPVIFEHCLFWKSVNGVRLYDQYIFNNCIFYGQTASCIQLVGDKATVRGRNNIFMPAAAADYVVYASNATGAVCDEALRKSCVWTIAGAKVTNHISVNSITRQLSDVIEEDPQFVDAANGDFRPRNPAVLRGGKPDISGNPTQMGAILQKYQFGDRERIANMARLRIIR